MTLKTTYGFNVYSLLEFKSSDARSILLQKPLTS